jgi:hypothetical protein
MTTTPSAIPSMASICLGEFEITIWADMTLTVEHWERQYTGVSQPARFTAEQIIRLENFLRPFANAFAA